MPTFFPGMGGIKSDRITSAQPQWQTSAMNFDGKRTFEFLSFVSSVRLKLE
jgi:hypothetical protein